MASYYESILNAVKSKLQGLALEGISAVNIGIAKVPTDHENTVPQLPGLLICPWASTSREVGTNLSDDVTYNVLVAMIQKSNRNQQENFGRALQWSQSIATAFAHRRLSGVPTVYQAEVINDTKFDAGAFFKNLDVSVILIRFTNRELVRGNP